MGRKSKSRRERRRERQAEASSTRTAPSTVDKPVNESRLRQLFSNLSHRGTKLFKNHVLSPVVVDAATPEEATAKTDQALVDVAKKQEPS